MSARLRAWLGQTRPGYRYPLGRIFTIYAALMVVVLLSSLDQTITATATPHIVSDLGGLSNYAWIFTAYLIGSTVTIPVYGKLADIHSSRFVLLWAIPIFLVGSALCGAAQNMTELIVFRAIQGAGAGALIPISMSTISQLVPPRDRGRYQGIISANFALASIIGPLTGGLIVDNTTWRWIFYANLPIGGLAFAVVWLMVPRIALGRQRSIDYMGAALLTLGTTSLLLALIWGGSAYAWGSAEVLGALAGAVVLLAAFGFVEHRVEETLLPYQVLRQPVVVACVACLGLATICMFGTIIYVPLFAQGVLGMSATSAGAVLTPLMLGVAVSNTFSGQFISRTGRYRGVALVSPIVIGAGMALLWRMGGSTTALHLGTAMFVTGLGLGGIMQVVILAAQNAVPLPIMGATTALLNFSRSLGRALGASIFAVLVNQGLPASVRGRSTVDHRLAGHARDQLINALHLPFMTAIGLAGAMFVIAAYGIEERPLRTTFEEQPETPGKAVEVVA